MTLQDFIDRKVKAEDIFTIRQVEKNVAHGFISKYHYLGDAKFFCKFAYGLYFGSELVGCAVYASPQGISTLKGWFGMDNTNQTVMELHRLCVLPELNGSNSSSYLLGNSIKKLKKEGIQAVITLADDSRHSGSIYQVCNFTYHGLTDAKTDFYTADGRLNPRGATKDTHGVWIKRNRKHRYLYLIDKNLKCLYNEQERPLKTEGSHYDCCGGTYQVLDKRFGIKYTCPKCTGSIIEIK